MTKAAWRISGSPALVAVALIVGLPAAADAQLLPNHNIKRERVACAHENPFNAHVRRDYFGYYPTCWSRFPAGWTCPCPNPELPNAAESFRKQPRDKPTGEPGLGPDEEPVDPDAPGEMPADPNLPPMPNQGRSPFDLDSPATTPERPATPRPSPPPFREPGSLPGDEPAPAPSPETRAPAPTGLLEMPQLPEPTTSQNDRLDALPLSEEAVLASVGNPSGGSPVHANLGPLPASPGMTSPVVEEVPTAVAPYPAKAPARKSVLGGLFNLGNRRRR